MGMNTPAGFQSGSEHPLGATKFKLVRLDTLHQCFFSEFEPYKQGFLNVLAGSYATYYGDDYHLQRLIDGQSIAYLALIQDEAVAVSYVKRNLRRGVTAVYPERFRRHGFAEALLAASFADFPEQYSILATSNQPMCRLLFKLGFKRVTSIQAVQ